MNDDNTEKLSIRGEQRREAILQDVLSEARRRCRRRSTSKFTAASIVIAAACGISTYWLLSPSQFARKAPVSVQLPTSSEAAVKQPPGTQIRLAQLLPTDPTISDRLAIRSSRPTWTTVTDDQLLQTLADAGQHAGFVYINGKAMLMTGQ